MRRAVLLLPILLAAVAVVAQSSLPRILVWESSLRGNDETELGWPVAVASASTDRVAVADASGSRVMSFRQVGGTWQLERVATLPAVPMELTHDGSRFVAVVRGESALIALEGDQLLQRRIGLPAGVVPGPIDAYPDGTLLLYDAAGRRVLRLSSDGALSGEMPIDGAVTAICVAPDGGFYVALGTTAEVLRVDASGEVTSRWNVSGEDPVPAWPAGVVAQPGGGAMVVDRKNGRIIAFDDAGRPSGRGSRRGWEPGLLMFPRDIDRLDDGRIVVTDQENGRVQVFRPTSGGGAS